MPTGTSGNGMYLLSIQESGEPRWGCTSSTICRLCHEMNVQPYGSVLVLPPCRRALANPRVSRSHLTALTDGV